MSTRGCGSGDRDDSVLEPEDFDEVDTLLAALPLPLLLEDADDLDDEIDDLFASFDISFRISPSLSLLFDELPSGSSRRFSSSFPLLYECSLDSFEDCLELLLDEDSDDDPDPSLEDDETDE